MNRLKALDGWRGIAILCVLAAHLLPLGLASWNMNKVAGLFGMSLFFVISGFLITLGLHRNQNVRVFLIKRILRIIPLAWLVIFLTPIFTSEGDDFPYLSHLFFYANLVQPSSLTRATSHFWSLCVEIQFYLFIVLLVIVLKKRALYTLPFVGIAVTFLRCADDVEASIYTYYRIDEVLAGCTLALLFIHQNPRMANLFNRLQPALLILVLMATSHPFGGALNYLRPYAAMLLVGSTIFRSEDNYWNRLLSHRVLFYVASISYALYLIHGGLRSTWLGAGDDLVRYAKLPLLLLVTFGLAHLSTFNFEKHWNDFGKLLAKKWANVETKPVSALEVNPGVARKSVGR